MLNAADHSYLGILSGQPRRSVTTILAEENYIEKRFYREGFAELGTQVHLILHAHDKGLNFRAPELYSRYIPPYVKMLEHTGIKIVDSEVEIEEPLLGYAGTLDKLALHPIDGYGIMDVKVSSCGWLRWHEFQSEAYRQGLKHHPKYKGLDIRWRGGIILGPECEIPRLIPHNRVRSIAQKWAALCIVNADKHEGGVYLPKLDKENGWYE